MKYLIAGALAVTLVPLAHAGEIQVKYSEDFTEKLNDDYGMREGETLSEDITKEVTEALGAKLGLLGDVVVTIEDARPNRPTFKQLGDTVGLSMQSISTGGAKLSANVYDVKGDLLFTMDSRYYDDDIRWAQYKGTWTDAKKSIDRFATKLDDKVEDQTGLLESAAS